MQAEETTQSADTSTRGWPNPATGFLLGLFGYLLALVAFGYEGLFAGGADAGDQLAAGLASAYLTAVVTSVGVTIASIRCWRRRRSEALGLLAGAMVGVVLLVLLSMRVLAVMDGVGGTCPCQPLIDQLRSAGG